MPGGRRLNPSAGNTVSEEFVAVRGYHSSEHMGLLQRAAPSEDKGFSWSRVHMRHEKDDHALVRAARMTDRIQGQLMMATSLQAWIACTEANREAKVVMFRVKVRKYLRAWQKHVLELSVVRKAHFERSLKRLQLGKMLYGFMRWSRNARTVARQRVRCIALLRRIERREVGKAMSKWQDLVVERIRYRKREIAIMRRIFERCLNRAWNTWRFKVADRMKYLAQLRRATSHWVGRSVAVIFQMWAREVGPACAMRRQIMRQLGKRLMCLSMSKALNRWREATGELAEQRRKAHLVGVRAAKASMVRAWNTWADLKYERERLLRLMRKAAAHFGLRTGRVVLRMWAQAAGVDASQRHVAYKQAVRRLAKLCAHKALAKWRDEMVRARHGRRVVRNTRARYMRRLAGECFESWEAVWRGAAGRAAAVAQGAKVRQRAMARLMFHDWRAAAVEARQQFRELQQAMVRELLQLQRDALNGWCHVAKEERKARRELARIMGVRLLQLMNTAWHAWRGRVESVRLGARLLAKVERRMADRQSHRMLVEWCREARVLGAFRARLAQVTRRAVVRRLFMCFAHWAELPELARLERVRHARLVARTWRRRTEKYAVGWLRFLRTHAAAKAGTRRKYRQLLAVMNAHRLDRAFRSWSVEAESQRLMRMASELQKSARNVTVVTSLTVTPGKRHTPGKGEPEAEEEEAYATPAGNGSHSSFGGKLQSPSGAASALGRGGALAAADKASAALAGLALAGVFEAWAAGWGAGGTSLDPAARALCAGFKRNALRVMLQAWAREAAAAAGRRAGLVCAMRSVGSLVAAGEQWARWVQLSRRASSYRAEAGGGDDDDDDLSDFSDTLGDGEGGGGRRGGPLGVIRGIFGQGRRNN